MPRFSKTKTTDRREAREVLKQKYRELEAAKGGFVFMPGPCLQSRRQ
ncbi:MAG TPA: hypothetical protein VFD81_20035 [Methylomirabilota bacterium]|nr:hypothetical protein [Methylomirabilota bacterium]